MEDFNKAHLQVDCGGGHSSNHDQGLAQEMGEGCINMNSTVDRHASNTLDRTPVVYGLNALEREVVQIGKALWWEESSGHCGGDTRCRKVGRT